MELQKSTGALTESVEKLTATVEKQTSKIDSAHDKLTQIFTVVGLARWFVGIVIGILGLLVFRLPDIIEALRQSPEP